MNIKSTHSATKLLWLTDLHLDRTDDETRGRFLSKIEGLRYDSVIITGDISTASHLSDHLREIAEACSPRPVYFVLGNHDFHHSSIAQVDELVESTCHQQRNLHHLGTGEIIRLNPDTALVGHRGWADGRAGMGQRTVIESRDKNSIADLRNLTKDELFDRMNQYGRESAAYFRSVLPYALECYRNVLVATHVPPFTQAAHYNGQRCAPTHLPHFANYSTGCALLGLSRGFPRRMITVLCGHTHTSRRTRILENLEVRVGGAQSGRPAVQGIIEFD